MKKYVALFLTFALLLTLTACGSESSKISTPDNKELIGAEQSGSEQSSADETQLEETQDAPFGDYHSEEELLAMLESGDFSAYLSVDPEVPAEPVDNGGDAPYAGFFNAITFADGGDGEGVEFADFMEQLSPEQRAEFEEMQEAMTDPEMLMGFEEMMEE